MGELLRGPGRLHSLHESRDGSGILATALRFAGNCADAYRTAPEPIRKLYNAALFTRISVRDGHIDGWNHHQPFDTLLNGSRFEYGSCVDTTAPYSNLADLKNLFRALRGVVHH